MNATLAPDPVPEALTTRDGFVITATRYPTTGRPAGRIVIAGATGVPQGFYRRFAGFAQDRDFEAMTLDYRGVGLSAPETLHGYEIDILDWGRQDLAAAIDAMPDDGIPLFHVGHSYGGHALGLLPNHARITGSVFFAVGAGWHGWMPLRERLRVLAMWHLVGPVLIAWKGYLPWSLLRGGEDLPTGVFRQWKRWCSHPHYFFDEPALVDVHAGFASVRTQIIAVNALDDGWAPPRSRDAFMRGYRNAPWQSVDLDPASIGIRRIGHMGYFRAGAEPLWTRMLDWFRDPGRPAALTTIADSSAANDGRPAR